MAWNPLSSYSNSLASSLAEQAESLREQLFGGGYTGRIIQEQMEAAMKRPRFFESLRSRG